MTLVSDARLAAYMQASQQRVQKMLQAELDALPGTAEKLLAAMKYACLQGGKRIRPILCYAAAEAAGTGLTEADSAACAVELVHCYSLVHDDLPAMDDDDLRRGQATVHKAFDEATAILAGDAMQALAFQCLATSSSLQVADAIRLQMLGLLSRAAGYPGMAAGQAIDAEATGQQLTIARLEQMHSLKTGALISASVQLGALCAGPVEEPRMKALISYAQCIGLSFQVHDDVLDVVGDTATLGKSQGADQQLSKPTYVSLLGLEGARQKAQELTAQALVALDGFGNEADTLRCLARYIVARNH